VTIVNCVPELYASSMTSRSRFVRIGQQFGRGTVILPEVQMSYMHRTGVKAGKPGVQRGAGLRCSCGNEYVSSLAKLFSGGASSCGCLQRELASERLSIDSEERANCKRARSRSGLTEVYGTPEYQKWYLVWNRYHLTKDEFLIMLAGQDGRCALCQEVFPEDLSYRPHIDHDHACCPGKLTCGKCIRGLLCQGCNRLLGWAEKVGLPAIDAYLDKKEVMLDMTSPTTDELWQFNGIALNSPWWNILPPNNYIRG
jgi:hypothetical protein